MGCVFTTYLVGYATWNDMLVLTISGYGDTSHLRNAVVNDYRRKADFDMVIVPSSRVSTSMVHQTYLDRSLHMRGPGRMMVVMNKIDVSYLLSLPPILLTRFDSNSLVQAVFKGRYVRLAKSHSPLSCLVLSILPDSKTRMSKIQRSLER
jgi:hypothetical protein